MSSGLSLARKSAVNAITSSAETRASADTASLFFWNCLPTMLQYVCGISIGWPAKAGLSTAGSSALTSLTSVSGARSFFISDTWVHDSVKKVCQQNSNQCHDGTHCENCHDQRVIVVQNRLVTQLVHSRYGKQQFDNDASADQRGQQVCHQRDDRDERIPERMPIHYNSFIQAFRSGRPDEILSNGFKHARAHVTRKRSECVIGHASDGKNQMPDVVLQPFDQRPICDTRRVQPKHRKYIPEVFSAEIHNGHRRDPEVRQGVQRK